MKTIETKGGQIIEVWESLKEALHDLQTLSDDTDKFSFMFEEDTLLIKYKDGKYFTAAGFSGEIEGKFRKTCIETIIYSNSSTTVVYGDYRIYNMDDVDEEYTEENDTEEKMWNVDER